MIGVSSEPEVFEHSLTNDDRVIVLGSDGLWEFISSSEAIKLIEECEQPEVRSIGGVSLELMCRKLWKY